MDEDWSKGSRGDAVRRAPRLAGRFTPARGVELLAEARAWAAQEGDVTVDCSELERLDLVSMQILVALKRSLHAEGRALQLVSLPETVSTLLALAGLNEELVS
jgi:ABC-type transporter Mla MlaB component